MNPDAPNLDGFPACVVEAVLPGGCDPAVLATRALDLPEPGFHVFYKPGGPFTRTLSKLHTQIIWRLLVCQLYRISKVNPIMLSLGGCGGR